MVVYQFDKPTETIFRYVCENPKANLIMLECLHNDYYNPKKSKANDNPKLYGDYAKSCTDYLVDCGLIFSKKKVSTHSFFRLPKVLHTQSSEEKIGFYNICLTLYLLCPLLCLL